MSRILIIDSENNYLLPIVNRLRQSDMDVITACCVVSGLEYLLSLRIDLIITIDKLPGLNAIDLLEIKREEVKFRGVPTIVASNSTHLKLESFKAGCDDFILLPIDESELYFRICAVLRRMSGRGMHGDFSDIGLLDLVQMLVSARRTGSLELNLNDGTCRLYFREGQVFHALCPGFAGEDAMLEILRRSARGGAFCFRGELSPDVPISIERRTDHLLLGLANMLDERG